MRCPECRREVDKNDVICPWCGIELPSRGGRKPAVIVAVLFGIFCVAAVILSIILFSRSSAAGNYRRKLDEGNRFLEEGNYQMAEVAFEEALKIDKKSVEARVLLADVYTRSAPEGNTEQEKQERQTKQEKARKLLEEADEQAGKAPAGVAPEIYEIYQQLVTVYQIQPSPDIYVVNVTINQTVNIHVTEIHTFIERILIEQNVILPGMEPYPEPETPVNIAVTDPEDEPGPADEPSFPEDPVTGLMLYLPFDGDIEDYSGSETKITAVMDEFVYEDGAFGQALYLNGDGDYLYAGRNLGLFGDFTFSVWVKPQEGNETRSDAAILAKYETNSYGPYDFFLAQNHPAAWISDGRGSHKEMTSETELPNDEWSFLTYVYRADEQTLYFYIDGVFDSEYTDLEFSDNDDLVTVGRQALMFEPYSDLQYWGCLDELKLFDRALDENEINRMHAELDETGLGYEEEPEEKPEKPGGWFSWDVPENGETEESYIRYSSNIGSRDGIIYADFLFEGDSGIYNVSETPGGEIRELGIHPAVGDYICGFVFYKDRLIYACKDAGTDGFNSAIVVSDPDGGNPQVIAEGYDTYTSFYIQDDMVVYDYRQQDADGTLMAAAYHLRDGTYSRIPSILEDDGSGWPMLEKEFFWDGYLYRLEKGTIYRRLPEESREDAELYKSLTGFDYYGFQGIEEGFLFFSVYDSPDGVLMAMDMETGTVHEISRHAAAGGGDAYFNW